MTENERPLPAPSLAQRAGRALRGIGRDNAPPAVSVPTESDELVLAEPITPTWVGWAVAVLVTAAPLLTLAGAEWLAARARAETARLEAAHAPRQAAAAKAAEARAMLRGALAGPALGPTLEVLAEALPPEDRLAAAAADESGVVAIEIATVDPDRLRAAIRGSRLGGLREAGQQRGDGVLLVRWAGRPG